jgi:hypothetical protein
MKKPFLNSEQRSCLKYYRLGRRHRRFLPEMYDEGAFLESKYQKALLFRELINKIKINRLVEWIYKRLDKN